jgi:hypothetical protein
MSQLLLPERPYLVGKDSVFYFIIWNDKNKKTGTSEIQKAVLVPKWGKLDKPCKYTKKICQFFAKRKYGTDGMIVR